MRNKKPNYVVATLKSWNIRAFHERLAGSPGNWSLITEPAELTAERIRALRPRYIFFPHWSHKVPAEILALAECVCFHETDLPFGRGGSPIQNLIARGFTQTKVTALRMTEELDAGPIYSQRAVSLEGPAEEIFLRVSALTTEMILEIVAAEPAPRAQVGTPTVFKRRRPEQSEITPDLKSLKELFDHLRMLDAEGYPRAYLRAGDFRIEFSRPALRSGEIVADARISLIKEDTAHGR
jgi:methionyl-tRNA formyltransferase